MPHITDINTTNMNNKLTLNKKLQRYNFCSDSLGRVPFACLKQNLRFMLTLDVVKLKLMLIFMQIPGNTEKLCQTYAIITYFMSKVREKFLDGNLTGR